MKKVYLFGFSALMSSFASAQIPTETSATTYQPKTNFDGVVTGKEIRYEQRAGGDILWSSNFDVPANWSAAGPASPPDNGWSIGNSCIGWAFPSGNMGTSGNFARFQNGDPGDGAPAVHQGGPFTLTYVGTDIPDLTGVPAPSIQFEQYGARFITLQAIQVSTNGGTTWTTVGDNNDITPLTSGGGAAYPKPMTRVFNISAAIAADPSNVSIRFMWDGAMNGASMNYIDYGWFVDNVRIVEGYSYDVQNESTYHRSGVGSIYPAGMEYYMIPTSQITSIDFSGWGSNQGAATHTGAALNVQVTKGSVVYTGSSAGVDLAPNASDSMAVTTSFTPSNGTGIYNIQYWFDGTNGEEVTNNDTTTDAIQVTDYMYARDNGVDGGLISSVTSSPDGVLQIGNVFEIFNAGVIGGAEVKISDNGDNVGQLMYVYLYKYDSDAGDYVLERSSADYVIQNGDLDNFVHFVFDTPLSVAPGDDILLVAGHYGGSTPVEFRTAQVTDEGTVLGYIDGSLFQLLSPEVVMIRADMRDFTGIEEVSTAPFTIGQNVPNPFDNTSVITYTLNETANVSVQITDATGKLVQTITPGTQNAGTYTMTIDASTLADGLYFYTFTVGETTVTKQMVVSKN